MTFFLSTSREILSSSRRFLSSYGFFLWAAFLLRLFCVEGDAVGLRMDKLEEERAGKSFAERIGRNETG